MQRLFFNCFLAFNCFFVFFGCSEEQNFDQFDDLSVTPLVASSIFYLESDEQFINTAAAFGNFYTETFNFDAFNEQFVAERLIEGTITYEIENTTSKRLDIIVEFLDEMGNTLDFELFEIEPAPSEMQTIEVPYGPGGKSLEILAATSNIRVTGNNLGDNTSVSSNEEPKIIMRSAAEFLFRLK
ncbi:hypothetical protein KIM67_04840 [Flagellimonas sp. 389]|uniref:hypothetical protein n=1 Tax=Flagellimonas sp. 389 TaxID=2835862 RepID=UPI001BD1CD66|nr:hypothetical protein [Flagellimonas sp. 389]MBS9461725.1 hypothetical protein [Flagellimonas sp. 389]